MLRGLARAFGTNTNSVATALFGVKKNLALAVAAQPPTAATNAWRFHSTTASGKDTHDHSYHDHLEDLPGIKLSEEKPPSAEYHRHSTRYYRTSRDVLTVLEQAWKQPEHAKAVSISDHIALLVVRFLRVATDSYFRDKLVLRAVMLETIAAVPGFVAGMVHHFRSLRQLNHCMWLKALTAEAENERMHLVSWLDVLKPSGFQHFLILAAQGVFLPIYFTCYVLFPRTSHRFCAALEVEACKTYTHLLDMVDQGAVPNTPAPKIARTYWNMPDDATLRDMVLVIRADEFDHVIVNQFLTETIRDKRRMFRSEGRQPCSEFDMDLHQPLAPPFDAFVRSKGKISAVITPTEKLPKV